MLLRPTSKSRAAEKQATYRQRRRERRRVYLVPLHEHVVDEAVDTLIRDGLKLTDRWDRRAVGRALAPFVERCLRQYRDRRLTVQITNLFVKR